MTSTLTAAARAPRPVRSSPVDAPVRLTVRGRLVVVTILVLLVLSIAGFGRLTGNAVAADPSQPSSGPVAESWVVQPGETLWVIAEQVTPGVDPRDTVARIVELNDLPDSSVQSGQRIFVPAS